MHEHARLQVSCTQCTTRKARDTWLYVAWARGLSDCWVQIDGSLCFFSPSMTCCLDLYWTSFWTSKTRFWEREYDEYCLNKKWGIKVGIWKRHNGLFHTRSPQTWRSASPDPSPWQYIGIIYHWYQRPFVHVHVVIHLSMCMYRV